MRNTLSMLPSQFIEKGFKKDKCSDEQNVVLLLILFTLGKTVHTFILDMDYGAVYMVGYWTKGDDSVRWTYWQVSVTDPGNLHVSTLSQAADRSRRERKEKS